MLLAGLRFVAGMELSRCYKNAAVLCPFCFVCPPSRQPPLIMTVRRGEGIHIVDHMANYNCKSSQGFCRTADWLERHGCVVGTRFSVYISPHVHELQIQIREPAGRLWAGATQEERMNQEESGQCSAEVFPGTRWQQRSAARPQPLGGHEWCTCVRPST